MQDQPQEEDNSTAIVQVHHEAPFPLQTVVPKARMYVPVQQGEGAVPAPYMTVGNIQAIAVGFVKM